MSNADTTKGTFQLQRRTRRKTGRKQAESNFMRLLGITDKTTKTYPSYDEAVLFFSLEEVDMAKLRTFINKMVKLDASVLERRGEKGLSSELLEFLNGKPVAALMDDGVAAAILEFKLDKTAAAGVLRATAGGVALLSKMRYDTPAAFEAFMDGSRRALAASRVSAAELIGEVAEDVAENAPDTGTLKSEMANVAEAAASLGSMSTALAPAHSSGPTGSTSPGAGASGGSSGGVDSSVPNEPHNAFRKKSGHDVQKDKGFEKIGDLVVPYDRSRIVASEAQSQAHRP